MTVANIFARAYQALDNEDIKGIEAAIDEAEAAGVDDDDARLQYLRFMHGFLAIEESAEDIEELFASAAAVLESAVVFGDPADAARITLDIADMLAQFGDVDDAEHGLRALTRRDDLGPEVDGEARMLHAQLLLDQHEDPEEAAAILDQVDASLHHDPGYVSLRAAILVELDRPEDAVELLEDALERDDEVELRYQLGIGLRELGREDEAVDQLLEVRRRDLSEHRVDPEAPVPDEEVEDLRRRVEDVLDTLPDRVIDRVAAATIRVERWPSEDAIREGADPRAPVVFEGEPSDDDDDGGRVDALVVYRDTIVAQIEDDDEIVDLIAYGLVEEFDRFFDLELIPGM